MSEPGRMQTRNMEPGDRGLVENILGAVLAGEGRELSPELIGEIQSQPGGYRAKGGEVWVQEANGALIGSVALRVTEGRAGTVFEIRWIAMVPAWRGMGIGRLLAETAIDHARAHKARAVLVRVPSETAPAYALFESLGFTRADGKPTGGGDAPDTKSGNAPTGVPKRTDIPLLFVFPSATSGP